MFQTDVLIIGGGPAGASTALGLLAYSNLEVVIVEHSDLTSERVGEHVSGAIFPLLNYLKLSRQDFESDTFISSHSHSSVWGSPERVNRDNIFTTEIETYQLNRIQFDLKLLETVSERGGLVFPRTKCKTYVSNEDGWQVTLQHPERDEITIQAKFLVDATGRKASVGRILGAEVQKKDKLTGVGMHMKLSKPCPIKQTIEAVENGWWYHAFLPNGIATAVFFSDADLISENKWSTAEKWLEELGKTVHVKESLDEYQFLTSTPWVRSASSQYTDVSGVPRFLAVGDAAAAFDPIASLGVGFSISSACNASLVIKNKLISGDESGVKQFREDIRNQFIQFESTYKYFYSKEKRWSDSLFWKRRKEDVEKNDH